MLPYLDNITKLQEDNRFYNWYHGYSEISLPIEDYRGVFNYRISSAADSGVVKTQNFGEAFKENLLEKKLLYTVKVIPPENIQNNWNMTVHFRLEKQSIKDLYNGIRYNDGDKDVMKLNYQTVDADMTIIYKNFTVSPYLEPVTLERKLTETDLSNLTNMPGFKVTWYYSGGDEEVVSQSKYLNEDMNKYFIRSH